MTQMSRNMVLPVFLLLFAAGQLFAGGGQERAVEEKKITVMHWDAGWQEILEQYARSFESENPGVQVEISNVPWSEYWQKLQTLTVAQSAPDLFWMNVPNFPDYLAGGSFMDLSDSGIDEDAYIESIIGLFQRNGKSYGVPVLFDSIAMIYNRELFDQAGLSYPDETWDWNTMLDAARKLTKKEGGEIVQYGFGAQRFGQHGYYNFMVSNGGGVVSADGRECLIDKAESIEAVQFLLDTMYRYEVAPKGAEIMESEILDIFTSGKMAMLTIGNWDVKRTFEIMGDKVGAVLIPKSPGTGYRKTIVHGVSFVASSGTRHPEETLRFLNHVTGKAFNAEVAMKGIALPAYKGMSDTWVAAAPGMDLEAFITAATEYGSPYPVTERAMDWMPTEWDQFSNAWLGDIDAETACRNTAEAIRAVIQ